MKIRDLLHPLSAVRAFEAVARLRSISAAAKDLGVTQPAISQQVKKLEIHLGIKLVERVSNTIRLSSEGEKLALSLHSAFGIMREGMEAAMSQGEVTVAVLGTFAQRWLIPRLPDLQERYPDVDLRLITRSKIEDLNQGGVDLIIKPEQRDQALKSASFLMGDEARIVMSPDLQKRKPVVSVADLEGHFLIKVDEVPRDQDWARWFAEASLDSLEPRGWHVFSNSSHALEAAVAGVGVAIGHWPMVMDATRSGRLVCPIDIVINQGVGYHIYEGASTTGNPHVSLVKDWLFSQVIQD
ncbi:LysR substrate-binding domain-containing protein [Kiloniella antarctica]|uniref:LysR substrate-binding domain-containing protein n=1 Tax=Kiloniella antarctica TaxID=1550907 RepID=A0ABW5BKX5_9PROT